MRLKKLILIGFMGSGKSTIAPLVAAKLGFTVVDADHEVVKRSGFASIPEIITTVNEEHFRDLEAQVAASLRDASSIVVASGGGVIGRPDNMDNLRHGGGRIVFLNTTFAEIRRRVPDTSSRPLFCDPVAAEQLYYKRLPIYRRYADLSVATDGKTHDEVSSEIVSWLEALP